MASVETLAQRADAPMAFESATRTSNRVPLIVPRAKNLSRRRTGSCRLFKKIQRVLPDERKQTSAIMSSIAARSAPLLHRHVAFAADVGEPIQQDR